MRLSDQLFPRHVLPPGFAYPVSFMEWVVSANETELYPWVPVPVTGEVGERLMQVCLNSGFVPFAMEVDINGDVACFNGAVDPDTGEHGVTIFDQCGGSHPMRSFDVWMADARATLLPLGMRPPGRAVLARQAAERRARLLESNRRRTSAPAGAGSPSTRGAVHGAGRELAPGPHHPSRQALARVAMDVPTPSSSPAGLISSASASGSGATALAGGAAAGGTTSPVHMLQPDPGASPGWLPPGVLEGSVIAGSPLDPSGRSRQVQAAKAAKASHARAAAGPRAAGGAGERGADGAAGVGPHGVLAPAACHPVDGATGALYTAPHAPASEGGVGRSNKPGYDRLGRRLPTDRRVAAVSRALEMDRIDRHERIGRIEGDDHDECDDGGRPVIIQRPAPTRLSRELASEPPASASPVWPPAVLWPAEVRQRIRD